MFYCIMDCFVQPGPLCVNHQKHMSASDNPRIQSIPVDLIHPGTFQARRKFDEQALAELAASIAESGIVQPVVVRNDGDQYELLAGERRWRASQLAGLHEIPAILRNDLDDREAHVLGLIENLQRESLSPMETARGLLQLAELFKLTHDAAGQRIGKSRAYVSNFLRLLKLDGRVQALMDDGQLSMGHARVLAGLPEDKQLPLARECISKGWSVRSLESAGRRLQIGKQNAQRRRAEGARRDLEDLQGMLSEHMGNKVTVDCDDHGRGEVRVRFHSLDEFEGLLDRWGVKYS